jgi:chemotaxis methyl-accepting protein methylase
LDFSHVPTGVSETEAGRPGKNREVTEAILAVVRSITGVDFSAYRPSTVERRILNRMITVGFASPHDYLSLLRSSADEAMHLLERITIKVSRFYRNARTFDMLRHTVLPELAGRRAGAPLRIWSAGCGYGEESYTLAMLLDERGWDGSVEATDIDGTALEQARSGIYSSEVIGELPADLRAAYLEPVQAGRKGGYRVREALRARVRFSRHDVTAQSPPGPHPFDLVFCRNVLIYLRRDMHDRTLDALCRSMAGDGVLCLGEAEWPGILTGSLEALAHKTCLFRAPRPERSGISA